MENNKYEENIVYSQREKPTLDEVQIDLPNKAERYKGDYKGERAKYHKVVYKKAKEHEIDYNMNILENEGLGKYNDKGIGSNSRRLNAIKERVNYYIKPNYEDIKRESRKYKMGYNSEENNIIYVDYSHNKLRRNGEIDCKSNVNVMLPSADNLLKRDMSNKHPILAILKKRDKPLISIRNNYELKSKIRIKNRSYDLSEQSHKLRGPQYLDLNSNLHYENEERIIAPY